MPSYSGSVIHVDKALSNLATAYNNHEAIGLRLAPPVTVDKLSDKFHKRNKANAFRFLGQPLVSNLETPAEIDQGVTQATFSCEDYALQAKVSQRDQQNADAPLNLMQDATIDVAARLVLAQEIRIATLLQTSGNYASANTTTLSGSDQWNSSGFGDPLGIIDDLRSKVYPSPGTRLLAWMGLEVWNVLKRHPQILGLVNGGATTAMPAMVMRAKLAEILEVDEVLVGEMWKMTNNPAAAESVTRVWGKHFGLARVAPGPTTRTLHLASSFTFGGMNTFTWYDEEPGLLGAWHVKVSHSTDELIVADDAGALVVDAIA